MELEVVTFEQAKTLEKLGFPQEFSLHGYYYTNCGILIEESYSTDDIMVPVLELVAKWLRETKDIHLEISYNRLVFKYECFYNSSTHKSMCGEDMNFEFDSYEDALSSGIDKALELLK